MTNLRKAAQQARSWIECPPQERQVSAGKVVAMLTEALAQPDVPEGYVLVPVEPTDEMVDAACAAVDDLYRVDFVRAYEAAIAQQKGGA